jgi:autotransporter-associated beta strand protein
VTVSGNTTVTVDVSNAVATSVSVNPDGSTNNTTATLVFNSGSVLTLGDEITIGGNGNRDGVLDMTNGGTLKLGGSATVMNVSANGTFTSGTGTVEYNRSGTQTVAAQTYNHLILSGNNTKTSAGNFTANGTLTIADGVTFDLSDDDVTVGGLATSGTGASTVITNSNNTSTLTINGTTTQTFAGVINSSNTTNVVKSGTGTQVFSGTNTYDGTTTNNGGILKITNASGTDTGTVSINNGSQRRHAQLGDQPQQRRHAPRPWRLRCRQRHHYRR